MSLDKTFGIEIPQPAQLAEILRQIVFPKVGVNLNGPDTAVIFNEITSTLLVRAPEEELATVAATIEMLEGQQASLPSRH